MNKQRMIATVSAGGGPWYLAGGVPIANIKGAWVSKGAASQASSYINLVTPGTNDLTTTSAPSWTAADGWSFNGSTFLDTGFVPADNQTWTAIVQYQGCTVLASNYIFGSYSAGGASVFGVQPNRMGGVLAQYGDAGSYVINSPVQATGNLALAGRTVYRNGVADALTLPAMTPGRTYATTYIGGSHLTTGALNQAITAGKVQCFALYNTVLSAVQVAAIYAAIQRQGFFLAP